MIDDQEKKEEIQTIIEEKAVLEEKLKALDTTKPQKPLEKPQEPDSREVRKRQEYLRMQRDKLVALKKEARKKQLDTETGTSEAAQARPKSAKAAEKILEGESSAEIDPRQLRIRKALAERLKSQVVNK